MKPVDYQQLREIFLGARERQGDERETWLLEACDEAEELLGEVRRLLASEEAATSFLELGEAEDRSALSPGDRIGPYILREPIGEGGFAEVFLAEQQEPVRRRVALKLLKPGMDSREILARFEAERQALALMQHSGIAKIFDAGISENGRSWFAMEHVPGVPITDYCDTHRLDLAGRLDLFIEVCEAIAHAHQKGIIHRDLKPSNILVGLAEGKPLVKVIDFGVAKATDRRLTEKTIFTSQGLLIGTPAYMSPEQAEMSGLDIDTRSDVYSLGILLYELLSGEPPFHPRRLMEAGYAEIQRIIREEEPPRPSTKSTTIEDVKKIAGLRCLDVNTLRKHLDGDLDWIAMKALEKDRTRRYATVQELAADLGRHLADEPVEASPPSASYRFSKFVRRHRVGVAAGSLVILALAAGIVTTTWQWQEARTAERQARTAEGVAVGERDKARQAEFKATTEQGKAEATLHFLDVDLFGAVAPSAQAGRGRNVTVREVLDVAAKEIEGSFADQPEVEARIRNTLGVTYYALGAYDLAQPHLERALALRRPALGDLHADTLHSMLNLGNLFAMRSVATKNLDRAEPLLLEAMRGFRKTSGPESLDTLVATEKLGLLLQNRNQHEKALLYFQKSSAGFRKNLGHEHRRTLETTNYIGLSLQAQGKYDQAEQHLRQTLKIRRRVLGDDDPETLRSINNMGGLLLRQGKADEAEAYIRESLTIKQRILGDRHPEFLGAAVNLGAVLLMQGKSGEAESFFRRALEGYRTTLGKDHPRTLGTTHNLAMTLENQGKYDEAEILHHRVLEERRRTLGRSHPETLSSLSSLSELAKNQGDLNKAEQYSAQALAGRRQKYGDGHPHTLASMSFHANLLRLLGKLDEAEKFAREAADLLPKDAALQTKVRALLDAIAVARKEKALEKQVPKKNGKLP